MSENNIAAGHPTRCAVYTRFSCDLQRPTSIEDQTRKCQQECARHPDWMIVQDWVVADRELSGKFLAGRDSLNALKEAAKRKSRPFDCVLIDDTSRFGRNLGDVLKLAEVFEHHGVCLQFVSPPLNSHDPNFRQLLIFKGMMDEQYSIGLADKVLRGLEGQVLRGYNAGSAGYGFKNVPDLDANGKELGMRLEIIPEQAEVVRRIFEMYAQGFSLEKVARQLRNDQVPPPKPPRQNSVRGWSPDGIGEMLRNKKYIGINEWHRTESSRDPETGREVTRRRPPDKWVRHENPGWRIVSDELWQRVQEQLNFKRRFGIAKHGGLSRTKRSENYLFSGLLVCGACSGPVSITDGSGDAVRYGCRNRRYRGACANATTICRANLEQQLLSWLTCALPQSDRIEQALRSFYAQVQKHELEIRAEAQRNSSNVPTLRNELMELKRESRNLLEFIGKAGTDAPVSLLGRLSELDAGIKKIEEQLFQANQPEPIRSLSIDELEERVLTQIRDLQSVLTSEPLIAKQVLRRIIKKITLTPTGKRGALAVTVDFWLGGGGDSGVMLTGTLESYRQHYGFPPITIEGLEMKPYLRGSRKMKAEPLNTEALQQRASE